VLVLCFLSVSLAHNVIPIKNMPLNGTFGDLARVALPYCISALEAGVKGWDDNILPGNKTIHSMRNNAGLLRDMMDAFIFAYPIVPNPKNASDEIALHIAEDAEKLWQTLGHFWDLHSKPYNQSDLKEKRDACIKALGHYNKNKGNMNYVKFLASPAKKIVLRNDSSLSTLFWGWTGVYPKDSNTAIQNLAVLEGGMWQVQLDKLDWLVSLPDIFNNTDSHHAFHAFRQLGRSCFDLIANFPQVYGPVLPADLLSLASQMHHNLGGVNGDVIKYHFYLKHNMWKEAHKYLVAGEKAWAKVQAWFKEVHITQVLKKLITVLIPH